jgi:hypothetical protein
MTVRYLEFSGYRGRANLARGHKLGSALDQFTPRGLDGGRPVFEDFDERHFGRPEVELSS